MENDLVFFKQKTAYERRISDLSSDDCSSDLAKEYSDFPLCCVSSGPRAVAAIPDMVWSALDDTVTVNILAASSIDWAVGDNPVKLAIRTDFPVRHGAEIVIALASPTVFTLRLRVPDWATAFVVDTGEEQLDGAAGTMFELRRQRSDEHPSELQSLMRISYAVFCL